MMTRLIGSLSRPILDIDPLRTARQHLSRGKVFLGTTQTLAAMTTRIPGVHKEAQLAGVVIMQSRSEDGVFGWRI